MEYNDNTDAERAVAARTGDDGAWRQTAHAVSRLTECSNPPASANKKIVLRVSIEELSQKRQ